MTQCGKTANRVSLKWSYIFDLIFLFTNFSIINKLEEHEYFFPPFQALIQDLLRLLGE